MGIHCAGGVGRLNDHISDFEPLTLQSTFTASVQHKLAAKFNFTAFGRSFHLSLKTHPTLFHPDFSLVVVGKEGVTRKKPSMKHFVVGSVEGEKNTFVYGRILDDSFDGVIRTKDETYHIDPLHHHPGAAANTQVGSAHNRIMYRTSDVEYTKVFGRCQSGNLTQLRFIQNSAKVHSTTPSDLSSYLRRKRQSDDMNTCMIRIVADDRFHENVGGGVEKNTLDEMVLHIMNADDVYKITTFRGDRGEIPGSRLAIQSSVIFSDTSPNNPLRGDFSVEELLEAFSEENFDAVCLGHLFTYRDFQGTIGLAYLGDPNGQLAGGICQKRTTTSVGDVNLNTGYTSLLNFGSRLSRAVSFITVAHEIGHNHGADHDPAGECFDGKYIMYPYATAGNNKQFSDCSKSSIGRTIEARGGCFTSFPSSAECGNGIIEGDEECDCGHTDDQNLCSIEDPCCLVNCTLKDGAVCSSKASTCCGRETCQPLNDETVLCLKGDSELNDGGCQKDTFCEMDNYECPPPSLELDGVPCNNGSNVCENGACTGSPCVLFENKPEPCYCQTEEELCHVCCLFDGECTSTFEKGQGIYVAPNYPCNNFTGYCTEEYECKRVNNDDILNNLKDILLNFASIWKWVKNNWYWVLGGAAAMVVLIILLQVTYRRKKITTDGQPPHDHPHSRWPFGRKRRQRDRGVAYDIVENSRT